MMTPNSLASRIAKSEGKKHEASIGDVREIVRLIIEIAITDMEDFVTMMGVEEKKHEERIRKEILKGQKKLGKDKLTVKK